MRKYLLLAFIFCSIIIVTLFALSNYSSDTKQILSSNFQPFPEEIRFKHYNTIDKVDALIRKEFGNNEITSRFEKFSLENYVGVIKVGVVTELYKHNPNDPFISDVNLLVEDINLYLKENGR